MVTRAAVPVTAAAVIRALRRLNSALAVSNRAVAARLGIKDSDLTVLDCLHQDGPQTPTELARRTRTHVATMTGILTRLERGGWIERRRTGTDRRSVQIHATGVDRLTDVYARADESLADLLEPWAPSRLAELIHFLGEAGGIATALGDHLDDVEVERGGDAQSTQKTRPVRPASTAATPTRTARSQRSAVKLAGS